MERGTEKRGIREEVKERRGGRRQVEKNSRVNCNNNSMKCIQLKNKCQWNSLSLRFGCQGREKVSATSYRGDKVQLAILLLYINL